MSAEKLELAQLAASASQAEPIIALDPQIVGPQADPRSQPRRALHRRTPNTKIDRRDCVAYIHAALRGSASSSYAIPVRVGGRKPDRPAWSGTRGRRLDYVARVLPQRGDALAVIVCTRDERPAPERAGIDDGTRAQARGQSVEVPLR